MLTRLEQVSATTFEKYTHIPQSLYCAICCVLLYPNDAKFRRPPSDLNIIPCTQWGLPPILKHDNTIVVCKQHFRQENWVSPIEFPGFQPSQLVGLNYIEQSCLSPIKIMSMITRSTSQRSFYLGHFHAAGDIWMEYNYLFTGLIENGTLGLYYTDEDKKNIDIEKVNQAWEILQQINPLIRGYSQPEISEELVRYFVNHDRFHEQIKKHGWTSNYLFPAHDIAPSSSHQHNTFRHLNIGTDGRKSISYSDPNLLPLLFPWLYPLGIGHWAYTDQPPSNRMNINDDDDNDNDNDNDDDDDDDDIRSLDNSRNVKRLTVKQYAKLTLCSADRRWARDPLYLFFMCDTIEKIAIHAYKRHVVSPRNADSINLKNLFHVDPETGEQYIREDKVTTIPHTIRSSYTYKRKAFLDMMARFRAFGEPQLFMTFSCDDFAPDMIGAVNADKPWDDPVLFAQHFQHKWKQFFNIYIKKHFCKKIGGIKHWAWVMEIQARGSPHMHCLFWTKESALELLNKDIISASLPPMDDPLRALVAKHQTHYHSPYCMRNSSTCRFGFPFPPSDSSYFSEGRFTYKRATNSTMINPYSPYLLNILKVNMDIQLNIGHRSLSYLCKYVTKLDTHHKFRIEKSGNANQNDDSLHFKARSIGSIEAVYDVLGLHKQSSDTDVLFLDTALPNERSRTIKTKLNSGESIYNDHTIDIYLQRPRNPEFENIAYPEYFANYARSYGTNTTNQFTDQKNRKWRKRTRPILIRYRYMIPTHGEPYYFQKIILDLPSYDFETAINIIHHGKYRDAYLHLVSTHQIPPPQDHVPVPVNDIPHPLEDQDADETIPDEQVTYLLNHQRLSHTELHERVSQLSPDQYTNFQTILRNVDDRLPTIVHGGAGTGKSFLLDTISLHYSQLRYTVFRLAYTGVAAYNINGVTLHRFFGMANQNRLVNPIRLDQTLQDNPKCIFLIDECSMLAADFVDELDKELRKAKKNQLPWGGLPVVFFGDFGQLQPWGKESHPFWRSNLASHHAQYRSLTTSIRQSGSIHFQTFLDQVRLYHFTSEVVATLASRCYSKSQLPPDCIHLFSTLKAAKAMNTRKLSKIPGTSRHYPATDNLSGMGDIAVQALEKTYLPKMLSLKLEAKVMLLQNLDVSAGWVNGRLAFVVKMDDDCIHIRAADHPDLTLIIHRIERSIPFTAYSRLQFPVTLAWAFTVHKVQSLTLSKVAIDFNNLFAHGHLYVALSRVRQLKHVYIVNWNARKPIRTFNYDESTISIIKQLSELSHNE